MKVMRTIWAVLLVGLLMVNKMVCLAEESDVPKVELGIEAASYVLMEASTGEVVCGENVDERRSPASITKIMTLLVIFDELNARKMKLSDEVVTSDYAKSMGGSQIYLEEGEVQTVDTLIKCIAVASGNDASVAMAEYIAGSEPAFVEMMNRKADELDMNNTHFVDCCGLTDSDDHYSSAMDVAIMSRELIQKYPKIYDYTKIWMEDIAHVTNKGSEPFTLSSTNKLLKQYPYTTGLKTGSTDKAKYCISATARNNDMDLIAVIMGAPDPKVRFQYAKVLLEYGFHICHLYQDANQEPVQDVAIDHAIQKEAKVRPDGAFTYLDTNGNDLNHVKKEIELDKMYEAPVKEGDIAGRYVYFIENKEIGSVPIVFAESIKRAYYRDYFKSVALQYFL